MTGTPSVTPKTGSLSLSKGRASDTGSLSLSKGRTPARVLLVPYLITLLLITWLPGDEATKVTGIVATLATWLGPLGVPFSVAYPVMEFLANIALFVPFGLLSAVSWPALSRWSIFAAGFATSGVIELVQLMLPTRYPTVSDLIANTLGAAIGCGVAAFFHRLRRARRPNLKA